ncbi:MAG TPA: hypothetical protein PKI34_13245, partial [Bacteroidales bacterium]|nr:hypothetical protein [Bacteroidales bacterium]
GGSILFQEVVPVWFRAETFNSYEGWQKAGKVVKKNSRPFLVWGRPVERTDEYGKSYSYFSVRYLYSNAQVADQKQS